MSEMVPKIRFQSFTDAWEQHKLDDVLTERNIQQPQTSEYPLVSFTVENGVTPKTERYEREQLVVGDAKSKKYKITEFNDIVYNPANLKFGAISRNSYGKAVFSPIYVTFVVDEQIAYPKFMEMFVTRPDFIQRALKYQQGTVYERQSVSPENLLSMNLPLPIKDEQSQIGLFFQKFDDIINFHQRKLDLLKEQKKGFLQKMFPKAGQLVPEIRFVGFTDDWEQRKLGDGVDLHEEIVSGKTGLPIATSSRKGLFLQNEFFSGNRTGIDENTIFHKVPVGFITYRHMSDDSIFKFNENIFDTAVLVSKEYPVFKSNEYSNQTFLLTHLNNSPEFLKFSTQQKLGGTRVRLYFKNLKKYELNVPSKEEQDSIGLFFKQLDNLITLHQRKLDLLKEQKKGFLQKMFVS